MKITALKNKEGAYEIQQENGDIFGGIIINGTNQGVGYVGDVENNSYIFEFEDGFINKTVRIYAEKKDNQIGRVKLGFTDSGILETGAEKYEWKTIGTSKIWTDAAKSTVIFLDLENYAVKPCVLSAEHLKAKTKELLILCGWYLTVVEFRAGLTNSILAGMPVKSEEFRKAVKANNEKYGSGDYSDWFDVLVDSLID